MRAGRPGYEWRTRPDDPGRSYLFRDGVQVAGYDHARDVYRTFDPTTGAWGPPAAPPWGARKKACHCHDGCPCGESCPCAEQGRCEPGCPCGDRQQTEETVTNFGVDTGKLGGKDRERYSLNGRAVSREQAVGAVAGPLADDSGKLRLTVIGGEDVRRRVREDLEKAPELAEFKDRLLVQDYAPDHWAVARAGFVTGGKPTVYLQQPDGKVLHRQDDYSGPADLAAALRRADPNYDTKKDPDLRRIVPSVRFDWSRIPMAGWLLAGGLVLVLLRRGQP